MSTRSRTGFYNRSDPQFQWSPVHLQGLFRHTSGSGSGGIRHGSAWPACLSLALEVGTLQLGLDCLTDAASVWPFQHPSSRQTVKFDHRTRVALCL